MNNHMKMEVGRFVCRVCNKYFFEQSKLKQHSLVHFSPVDKTGINSSLSRQPQQHHSDYVTPLGNFGNHNEVPATSRKSRFRTPSPPVSSQRRTTKFDRIKNQVERNSQYFVASKTFIQPSLPTPRRALRKSSNPQIQIKPKAKVIKKYKCRWCDKEFPFHCRYREHLKTHHLEKMQTFKEYPCNECGLRFQTNTFANVHKEHYHDQRPQQQPRKSVSGPSSKSTPATKPKAQVSQAKPSKRNPKACSSIHNIDEKRSVFSGGQIENPVIIGTPNGTPNYPFKCTICPFGHYSKTLLQKHEKLHLTCHECKYEAKHIVFYMYHMRRHHNPIDYPKNPTTGLTPIICPICTMEFNGTYSYSRISRHLQNHTGFVFTCEICEQKFIRKELLNKHYIKTHRHYPHNIGKMK